MKCKYVIDFVKGVMNQAVFDLASKKELCKGVKKSFQRWKGGRKGTLLVKNTLFQARLPSEREGKGPTGWVILLVLTRLIAG